MIIELGLGNNDISKVKDYWNSRPCNIKHSNKEIGSKEYFNEVSLRRYYVEPHIVKFANFENYKNKKVLEIGCGIGTDAAAFVEAGAIYTGIDLSVDSIVLAKKRFEISNLDGKFFESDAEALDLLDDFDLIYSFGVIHHSPNPRRIIEAAYRLARPGAELKIMLYAKNSWKATMIEAGLDQPEAQNGCPIALAYDEQDVNILLEGCFQLTGMEQAHIFPFVVDKYKNYEYELLPYFKEMPKPIFDALSKKYGWHLLISAVKI